MDSNGVLGGLLLVAFTIIVALWARLGREKEEHRRDIALHQARFIAIVYQQVLNVLLIEHGVFGYVVSSETTEEGAGPGKRVCFCMSRSESMWATDDPEICVYVHTDRSVEVTLKSPSDQEITWEAAHLKLDQRSIRAHAVEPLRGAVASLKAVLQGQFSESSPVST